MPFHGPPTPFGPYTPLRKLGEGANCAVWLARGPAGLVAIKAPFDETARQRLRSEAALVRSLGLACTAAVLDADADAAWVALEFIDGPTADVWAAGRTVGEVLELAAQVAEGLAHLHRRGVVHGDVKPGNVLVESGNRPRIIDLGVAALDAPPRGGGFRGTLGYASPEQLRGEATTPRSDAWSLGALAYQLVTGHSPFRSGDPVALAWLPLKSLPEPPSSQRPRVPGSLDDLLLGLLARDATRRPFDLDEVAREFRRCGRDAEPARPVLGMQAERELLRRLVVEAADGAPVTAVIHGCRGSGRSTLQAEAVRAAVREGMALVELVPDAPLEPGRLLESLPQTPVVVVAPSPTEGLQEVVERCKEHPRPMLMLVRSLHPLPDLARVGAIQLAVPPLGVEEVRRLLDLRGLDPAPAARLHRVTRGTPGALLGLVSHDLAHEDLDPTAAALLRAVSAGPVPVPDLAARLGITAHDVLDVAEALMERGLLVEVNDGAALGRGGD